MAGSLTGLLICVLGIIGLLVIGGDSFCGLPVIGILVTGAGYMVGVRLSLSAPRRAQLGGWIAAYFAGLIAGIVLLAAALFCWDMGWKMTAVFGKWTSRILDAGAASRRCLSA